MVTSFVSVIGKNASSVHKDYKECLELNILV